MTLKIKTIDIYGYGKWINQRFDLDNNIQLFFGRNESGKSTLQSFIRSIFFGFPDRRKRKNQANQYRPKQSDVYGGRLFITDSLHGDVWIERTNKSLTITRSDGEVLPTTSLNEMLGGLDESLFDTFYSFTLNNLQDLSNIGSNQLNDYFLSIGTLGSDKFLSIAKDLEKESSDLFKAKGQKPALNQLLASYDKLSQHIQKVKASMDRYDGLVSERKKLETIISHTEEEINKVESQLRARDQLISRYDIYLKSQAAESKLKELEYTPIDESDTETLKEVIKSNKEFEQEILIQEETVKLISDELTQLTRYHWANNHQSDRKKWIVETDKIRETQTKIEQLYQRIQESNESLTQLAHRGQFYPEKVSESLEYEEKVEEGLFIQTQKSELKEQIDAIVVERKILLEQRKNLQNKSANFRQHVAKLENQRVNDEEILIQSTSLSDYLIGLIFLLIGIFVVAFNNLGLEESLGILSIIGVILSLVGFGILINEFVNHRKILSDFNHSPIPNQILSIKEKEEQINHESRLLGIEINRLEDVKNNLQEEFQALDNQQKKWLNGIGFYPTADPEIILKANPVKQYFDESKKKSKYEEELRSLLTDIDNWKELLSPLLERFPLDDDSTRVMIRHVEEIEASLVQSQLRGNKLNERLEQIKEYIETSRLKIQNNQEIIDRIYLEATVKNQVEFDNKLAINHEIKELQAQSKLYKEQIQGFEEELKAIENKNQLLEEYSELELEIKKLKNKLSPYQRDRADLSVEISQLEQDGTYQDLSQQQENLKSKIMEEIEVWASKKVASDIIYQTLRKDLDNPVEEMNEIATRIFSTLSYDRYNQIKMNMQNIKVRQFSDVLFEPHELSQGTLEQLYVALRLAFIISARTMIKMPIIIDDAFVNFDEYRKQSMYEVLKNISEDIQILYFTFDQHAKESFDSKNIINLEEIDIEYPATNESLAK